MRVLVVQETDWIERNPIHHHHLMERLSLQGYEITVVDYEILWAQKQGRKIYSGTQLFKDVSKIYDGAAITVVRPGMVRLPGLSKLSSVLTNAIALRRIIRGLKPDIIVDYGLSNGIIALAYSRIYRVPLLFHTMEVLYTLVTPRFLKSIARLAEKALYRKADRIVVINNELRDKAVKLGADPAKISVLPAGVNLDQFSPSVDGSEIRREYGLKDDDVVLFFMGWLYDFCGLKEIALALTRLKDRSLKLLVVGDGDLFSKLYDIKVSYLHDDLILADKQPYDKIPSFIAAADICLLPSQLNEVTRHIVPMKLYEYLAVGKPVISTNLPGVREEIGQDNGVIYVDEPSQVVAKAMELVADRSRLAEYGQKARRFAEMRSWDKVTEEFKEILESTAGNVRIHSR